MISLYSKKLQKHLIYTSHFAEKSVYYFSQNGKLWVSDNIKWLTDNFQKNDTLRISEQSVIQILTFGYLLDDATLFENIFKLSSGSYLYLTGNATFEKRTYFTLDNTPTIHDINDDVLEELNFLYEKASERCFDLGLSNKKKIASLSGGLDSRIVVWGGRKYCDDLTGLTFSQTDYLDETIPKN